MALIRSEISKYKDIVLALDREMHNHGQKEIAWDSFTHKDSRYSPHGISIGKVSDELKQMGFMSIFTYDKEHLKNSMFPEESAAPHAHGLTVEELLRLRQLLNNPVAIMTERDGRTRNLGDGEYKCLHFLCAVKEDGEQKYYKAVVQPQAYHNGLLNYGFVSKVITYYEIDENRFTAMLNGVLNNERQMLYFDNKKYLEIDSDNKPIELYDYESKALPINGHFTRDANLRKVAQDHQIAVHSAVTAEMNKLIVGKGTRGESFPIFDSSIKALEHGNSFDTILSAYNTVQRASTLTQDRILRLRTQEYADKSFARSYMRLMTQEKQQNYITRAVNKIQALNVTSKDNMINVCDEIDRVMSTVPTLSNMKVNFSDKVSNVKVIMDARQISGQFQEKLEESLANVLREKSAQFEKDNHEHRNINYEHDGPSR